MLNKNLKYAYIILTIFSIIILGTSLLNHYYFRTFALDYASYNFAWYDYAHFRVSPNPLYYWDKNNLTFFQDHFSLTLIILAPLYWIMSPIFGTYSLLIIQTVFIVWGGWAVYKYIYLKTKKNSLALSSLLLYFLTYGRFSAIVADVNLDIILSSLIPVFLYYFEKQKFKNTIIIFIFIIIGRENFSLWFIFIGIFLLITNWKNNKLRVYSLGLIISSFIYFIMVFKVLIPYFENPNRSFALFNYSILGSNPFAAFKFIINNPLKVISYLYTNHLNDISFDKVKQEFYLIYLLSGGFVLLFRPKYIILFIPIIAQKMFNDLPLRWSSEFYYGIEVVSILPIAVFSALDELNIRISKNANNLKKYLSILIVILATGITIHQFDFINRELKYYGPEKNKFYDTRMYSTSFDINKIHNLIKQIPDNARISASGNIAPHLAFRKKIYYFPRVDDAEYIVILTNNPPSFMEKNEFLSQIEKYKQSPYWNTIINEFPLIVMKKIKK